MELLGYHIVEQNTEVKKNEERRKCEDLALVRDQWFISVGLEMFDLREAKGHI